MAKRDDRNESRPSFHRLERPSKCPSCSRLIRVKTGARLASYLGLCIVAFHCWNTRSFYSKLTENHARGRISDEVEDESGRISLTCIEAVEGLVKGKILLIAIDFDLTIISIHTGGRWKWSADDLVPYVRPEFRCIICECLQKDIHVAVATFSDQVDLISDVLAATVAHDDAAQIPIYGGTANVRGSFEGKRSQLLLAVEHVEAKTGLSLPKEATVLVDDDRANIARAKKDGYKTIFYDPTIPHNKFPAF
jgi:hypothetical protein